MNNDPRNEEDEDAPPQADSLFPLLTALNHFAHHYCFDLRPDYGKRYSTAFSLYFATLLKEYPVLMDVDLGGFLTSFQQATQRLEQAMRSDKGPAPRLTKELLYAAMARELLGIDEAEGYFAQLMVIREGLLTAAGHIDEFDPNQGPNQSQPKPGPANHPWFDKLQPELFTLEEKDAGQLEEVLIGMEEGIEELLLDLDVLIDEEFALSEVLEPDED